MTSVKFCGLTRAEDVLVACALGARYVGAILTESPRRVSADKARALFSGTTAGMLRVAVFGREDVATILRDAGSAGADVIQLHGDQRVEDISTVKRAWPGEVWWVARTRDNRLPPDTHDAAAIADGVVLDTKVAGRLGGTGMALDWNALRDDVRGLREVARTLVLAGGLDASNVRRAVDALQPDVVDVSSGVESTPGVKDHALMLAFRDAVAGVATA